MEKIISIRIREGQGFLDSSTKIDDAIAKVGLPAVVTVKHDSWGISEKQRGYYFWVVVEITRQYHWYSKEEMHGHLKRGYLPDYEELLGDLSKVEDDVDSVRKVMQRFLQIHEDLTITNETTGSFEEYLKRIRESYSRQNVHIPLPNEDQQWEWWERMK